MWFLLWCLHNWMRTYLGRLLEMLQKVAYLGTLLEENSDRHKKLFEGLNLESIELWTSKSTVLVEGQKARALIDWSIQISNIQISAAAAY